MNFVSERIKLVYMKKNKLPFKLLKPQFIDCIQR